MDYVLCKEVEELLVGSKQKEKKIESLIAWFDKFILSVGVQQLQCAHKLYKYPEKYRYYKLVKIFQNKIINFKR